MSCKRITFCHSCHEDFCENCNRHLCNECGDDGICEECLDECDKCKHLFCGNHIEDHCCIEEDLDDQTETK